jgi:epidermal growth factor receptor substrate 15
VSNASSRDSTHEKEKKEKNSRLSIRLPFGRKKNKHEQPPPMPSVLTPPTEETEPNNATPAADDDLDVVKQLCGMGFSRQQAVTALEANGYDMQRALNSLIGQ